MRLVLAFLLFSSYYAGSGSSGFYLSPAAPQPTYRSGTTRPDQYLQSHTPYIPALYGHSYSTLSAHPRRTDLAAPLDSSSSCAEIRDISAIRQLPSLQQFYHAKVELQNCISTYDDVRKEENEADGGDEEESEGSEPLTEHGEPESAGEHELVVELQTKVAEIEKHSQWFITSTNCAKEKLMNLGKTAKTLVHAVQLTRFQPESHECVKLLHDEAVELNKSIYLSHQYRETRAFLQTELGELRRILHEIGAHYEQEITVIGNTKFQQRAETSPASALSAGGNAYAMRSDVHDSSSPSLTRTKAALNEENFLKMLELLKRVSLATEKMEAVYRELMLQPLEVEPIKPIEPIEPNEPTHAKTNSRWLIIGGSIALVLILGAAIYFFVLKKN